MSSARTALLSVAFSFVVAQARTAEPSPAGPAAKPSVAVALDDFVPEPLPPAAPGREVLFDSRSMGAGGRQLRLSDLDPEQGEIIREINRKPGTWQAYLLYTAEDLPEKLFHPGFAIRFPPRTRPPVAPAVEPEPMTPAPPATPRPASSPEHRPLPR